MFLVFSNNTYAASSAEYVENAKSFIKSGELKAAIIELKNSLQKNANNSEARYLLGTIYLKVGDGSSAEQELERALRLGAAEKDIVVPLANSYLLQGQTQRILDEIEIKKSFPDDVKADLFAYLGEANLLLKEYDKAKVRLEKALKLNAKSVTAQLGMARFWLSNKKYEKAEKQLKSALQIDATSDMAIAMQGEVLRLKGDIKGAGEKFNQAIKLNPYNMPANLGSATVLIAMEKFSEGIKKINAIRKIAPNNPMVNYLYAVASYKTKKFKDALDSLQLVLRVFPSHVSSLQFEGAIRYGMRQFEQAGQSLSKVVAVQPENINAIKLLAATRVHLKQPEDAIEIMEPLLSKHKNDAQLMALLGSAYMQVRGGQDQGLAYLTKAAELSPDVTNIQTQLAIAQLATGKETEAIEQLESTVKLDSEVIKADILLVMAHLKKQDYKKALTQAKKIQKKQDNNPVAYNLMGAAYLGLKQEKEAVKHFNKALKVNSNFIPAMVNLAKLDEHYGNTSKAKKRYEKIVEISDGNVGALMSLAKLAERDGKIEKALAYVERAKNKNPHDPIPGLFLVRYYAQQKNHLKAVSIARELKDKNPKNASVLKALGLAQIAADQKNNALATFSEITKIYPDAVEGYYLLGKAYVATEEYKKARAALEKGKKKDSKYIPISLSLVELALKTNNSDEAKRIAKKIQKQQPELEVGYVLEGDIYSQLKQYKNAQKAYKKGFDKFKTSQLLAKLFNSSVKTHTSDSKQKLLVKWVEDNPKDIQIMLLLATSYQAQNKNELAINLYKKIIKDNPQHVLVLNNLAWLLHLEKDSKSLEYAEKAYKLASKNPAVADTYGWILVHSNKANKGLVILQQAALRAPDLYDIRYHLAVALNAVGRKAEAKKELEQVLQKNKEFSELKNAKKLLRSLQ